MVEEKATKKFPHESNNLHAFIDTSHLVVYEQFYHVISPCHEESHEMRMRIAGQC